MPNFLNSLRQKWRKEPKVFIVGFNKCGTKTLHKFFLRNGFASAHCNYIPRGTNVKTKVATTMRDNIEHGRPILKGMEHYQFFSDLITLTDSELIEANRYFKEMHEEYPDAFFILNDRPVQDWIKSRINHEGGLGGSFIGRSASALGVSIEEVPDIWREQYFEHKQAVLEHFKRHDRFLHFHLGEHGPKQIVCFLGEAIALDMRKWRQEGSAAQRRCRQEQQSHVSWGVEQ